MSDKRDSLERELSALLAVQPSANLEARIRGSIAEYPHGRRVRFRFPLVAASLICAVILFSLSRRQPTAPPVQVLTRPPAVVEPLPEVARQESLPVAPVRTVNRIPLEDSVSVAISYDSSEMNALEIEPIVVQPLNSFEITENIQPLPEMRLPEIPDLTPMAIPALDLSAQQTEVNE